MKSFFDFIQTSEHGNFKGFKGFWFFKKELINISVTDFILLFLHADAKKIIAKKNKIIFQEEFIFQNKK